MICLADNDILLKLSCCDLLIPLFDTLDIPYANIHYLPSLPYMLTKKNLRDKYNVGVDRLLVFLNRISPLTFSIRQDELALLNGIDDVDTGEVVLFSSDVSESDYIIATGDKRCLRALANAEQCDGICTRLREKVLCLEVSVLLLIRYLGFEAVRAKVTPALHCDKALQTAFGSGLLSSQENVEIALHSYFSELNHETKELLMHP